MGFKAKAREWKRRLVHLLVIVLLLNNVYCLPVMAQTDEQGILVSGDVLESVSGGDVLLSNVMEEQGEETRTVVSITATPGMDTFYYEYGDMQFVNAVQALTIMLDDGTVVSCTPFDEVWNSYGFEYSVLDMEGNVAQWDSNYKYPVGDYVFKIYLPNSDVNCQVPVTEIYAADTPMADVAEIRMDVKRDTFYFELNDMYIGNIGDCVEIVLKDGTVETCIPFDEVWEKYGLYSIVTDMDGNIVFTDEYYRYPIGEYLYKIYQNSSDVCLNIPVKIVALSERAVTIGLEETISCSGTDTYYDHEYYGADGHWFRFEVTTAGLYEVHKNAQGVLRLVYADGTQCWVDDIQGGIRLDANQPGTYYVFAKGSTTFELKVSKILDFEVLEHIAGIDAELVEDTFYYETGTYPGGNNVIGNVEIVLDDGSIISCKPFDEVWNRYGLYSSLYDMDGNYAQVDETSRIPVGNYINKIWVYNSELSIEIPVKVVPVADVAIELKSGETISGLTGCVDYTSTDTKDGHWIKCELKAGIYALKKSAPGSVQYRNPQWIGTWWLDTTLFTRQIDEPGTYYFYVKGSETFDVTLLSVDDMATEISVGDTITGLSPHSNPYDMEKRYDAHIFKVEIDELGRYIMSKSVYGMMYVEGPGNHVTGVSGEISNILTFDATQPGTYYIYVMGNETFDLTLTKAKTVVEIHANVVKDSLYCEIGNIGLEELISSIELTFDDGTVATCEPWDELWNACALDYDMLDEEGYWPEWDDEYRYLPGNYRYVISASNCTCEIPWKMVSLKEGDVEFPKLALEPTPISELRLVKIYEVEIAEAGDYELKLSGNLDQYCFVELYHDDLSWVIGCPMGSAYPNKLGRLEAGNYIIQFSIYDKVPEDITLQLARVPELDKLEYSGSDIVWKYGEWGYKISNDVSANYVSTRALSSNYMLSGNQNLDVSMPIKLEGTLTDGSNIEIPFNQYMQVWRNYKLDYKICKADGTTAYTDRNGYLANGDYLIVVTSGYGSVRVEIPFKVTGGPVVPSSWTYSGATQEMKYGTWGYKISQSMSGNRVDVPMRPNADLNGMVSGNNVLALDFKVTAKSDDGQTDTVSYGSKAWNLYRIKTYFYDAEGNSVRTDQNGYIPAGTYVMKCEAYNGTEFELPLKVYKDAGDIAEEQLSTAVDEMLAEAEKLTDETLTEATEEEKKTVVEEVLQKVEEIYENQEIAEIGAADADKAIELAEKLEEVEKQIEELLSTSITVAPQDTEAEEIEVQVKNALLSVPAGENAQIKVTTAEVPENIPVEKENASAIQLELVAESEEKMQLNAPVIVTVKVPEGIDTNEEIWVYHFAELQEKAKEIIKAKLNGDGTLSFVTGSFSTFVIANAAKGASVSGVVVSFGDEAEEVTIKVLNGDKVVVEETVSAAETGAYQFEQLEAGEYTLVFSKSNHVEREYSITVAEENVVLDAEIYLLGDVDGNGKVNARDKKTVYNHIAGESELTGYEFQVGDTDGNGKINARDKKMIYNHISGEDLLW